MDIFRRYLLHQGNVAKGILKVGDQRRIDLHELGGTPYGVAKHHMLPDFGKHF